MLTGTGEKWLELGSGTGRIADACIAARSPLLYVGVELDQRLLRQTSQHAEAVFMQGDALDPQALHALLGDQLFDRVTANPPYGIAALAVETQARLAALCPGIEQVKNWVQLDLFFILESLARLRRPGEAAFIIAAPMAEDARLMAFRRALVGAASEVECYELPATVFDNKAEVQSYMLIARFGQTRCKEVTVGRIAGPDLAVLERRLINLDAAVERLDIAFHEFTELDETLRRQAGSSTLR
ncbi:N-6 DNA methylase [Polaromonas sp. P1(28)-13]|nr:N-6 DNA methylase [Polaromonas sp. P1(28)-13]